MTEVRIAAGRGLAAALVAGSLVLPFVGGYALAYGLMIVSLALIGWWLTARPRLAELREPAGAMMAVAVLLIGVAFAATAKEPSELAYLGNFAMLALFPLLRAAMARLAQPGSTDWVAAAALAGSAIAALIAIVQVTVLGSGRAQGFGSDPIWAAQAALLTGFLALAGFGSTRGRWRYVLLLGPVLGLGAVLLTGSRGPLLAALPLLALALVAMPGRRLRPAAIALGAIILAGLLALAAATDSGGRGRAFIETAIGVFSPDGPRDASVAGRLTLYTAGFRAFTDSPLVGHGWEHRVSAAYGHVPGGETAIVGADPMMQGNRHLHADILDFGVGAGLLGVVAYLLILAAPVAGALASPRDSQRQARIFGMATLSGAYLFCGLSYIMIGYEFPTTLFVVVAAIILGLCRDPGGRNAHAPRRPV